MLAPSDIRAGKGQVSYFEVVRMERMVKRSNTEVGIADLFNRQKVCWRDVWVRNSLFCGNLHSITVILWRG
jgi:hypothetical protein